MSTPRTARKPSALLRCVANAYAGAGVRIVEVSFEDGSSALIQLRQPSAAGGRARIEVYGTDDRITVLAPAAEVARQAAIDLPTLGALADSKLMIELAGCHPWLRARLVELRAWLDTGKGASCESHDHDRHR